MGTGNDKKLPLHGPSDEEIAKHRAAADQQEQSVIEATSDKDTPEEIAAQRAAAGVTREGPGRALDPNLTRASKLPPKSGLFHSMLKSDKIADSGGGIVYLKAQNEKIITSMGAYIVLGTDRPESVRSGYGAWGADKAASIDLVVGRLASAREGKGPEVPSWINNDFAADAARVYISQLADIDRYFGLVRGVAPQSIARSAVGIKADAVRIIGRESVKIVSGPAQGVEGWTAGEPTSHGGKIVQPAPAIEFIAGNKITDRKLMRMDGRKESIPGLQGIAMGYNTRDAFQELADIVGSTLGACNAVAQAHIELAIAIGLIHPLTLSAITAKNALGTILRGNISMYHLRGNLNTWRINYLSPAGAKCIWSRNVKTN